MTVETPPKSKYVRRCLHCKEPVSRWKLFCDLICHCDFYGVDHPRVGPPMPPEPKPLYRDSDFNGAVFK